MKKIYTILISIIVCIVFSSNVSAMNINSPYYPLDMHLSDPDINTLALRLVRRQYELDYLEKYCPDHADKNSTNNFNDYFSISFSSPPDTLSETAMFYNIKVKLSGGGNMEAYNGRRSRVHAYYSKKYMQRKYENTAFFQDQVKKAKEYQNTRDQIKSINDFLCGYLEYDFDYVAEKRKNGGYNIEDAIKSRKGVCGEYATLANIFLNLLDIPNYLLSSGIHAWNYVYVDGEWKHLDVTWSDIPNAPPDYAHFLVDNHSEMSPNCDVNYTGKQLDTGNKAISIMADEANIKTATYAELDELFNQNNTFSLSESDIRRLIIPKHYSKKWGLAPDDILSMDNLEAFVTRKDFCRILAKTIEKISDKPIEEILTEKQVAEKPINFLDTDDAGIIALAKLGVIAGTGNGYFNPEGYVSKTTAAVFIDRVAEKVFGIDTKSQTIDWTKMNMAEKDIIINSWYKDSIAWATIHGIVDDDPPDIWYYGFMYNPDVYKTYLETMNMANKLYVILK